MVGAAGIRERERERDRQTDDRRDAAARELVPETVLERRRPELRRDVPHLDRDGNAVPGPHGRRVGRVRATGTDRHRRGPVEARGAEVDRVTARLEGTVAVEIPAEGEV